MRGHDDACRGTAIDARSQFHGAASGPQPDLVPILDVEFLRIRAVQVGGPLGAYHPLADFHLPFDYEAFAAADGLIGHGGIVVFDDSVDMAKQARFAMQFCAVESCGKCTPCRLGSTRGVETLDRVIAGDRREENLALIADLCETMKFGSLCALGGFTPYPVMSAINRFPEDFR